MEKLIVYETFTEISKEQAHQIYDYMCGTEGEQNRCLSESGLPFVNSSGKYYLRDGDRFIGFDFSSDYDGFVDDFERLEECLAWLNSDIDKNEILEEENESKERDGIGLDEKIQEASVLVGSKSVVGIGAFSSNRKISQGLDESVVLRNNALNVCYGIPGYEMLSTKEKNQLYDLVKKAICLQQDLGHEKKARKATEVARDNER